MRALLPITGLLLTVAFLPAMAEPPEPTPPARQQIDNLDDLLNAVKADQQREKTKNKQREQEFLRARDNQQALLQQARRDFDNAQKHNNPLKQLTEANAAEIARLKKQLERSKQDMGDIYGTFTQMAGDFATTLQASMITVQLPQRQATLSELQANNRLAGIGELETLWLLVQEEMTEQGKIARFQAPVVSVSGAIQQQPVTRIGGFTAFSEGSFLRYIPETGEYLALERQPSAATVRLATEFAGSGNSVMPMVIDPTGGSLLGVLSYVPTMRERIDQGGAVGLIIIGLGVLGLAITVWRISYLGLTYLAIRRQLANIAQPTRNNPLGRVILSADQARLDQSASGNLAIDGEIMQYKLDEAILAELPALERGHSLIKLLAATSPLLGLLGTVTGMILTFQAISLFGSGDPKLMAGGISQALITTVLGLVVAIPLLFGYSLVAALAGSMIQRLDEQSAGIMAKLIAGKRQDQG